MLQEGALKEHYSIIDSINYNIIVFLELIELSRNALQTIVSIEISLSPRHKLVKQRSEGDLIAEIADRALLPNNASINFAKSCN